MECLYLGLGEKTDFDSLARYALKIPPGNYFTEAVLPEKTYVFWSLAQYRYDAFKDNLQQARQLFLPSPLLEKIVLESEVIFQTRDLINGPANHVGPEALAKAMSKLSKQYGGTFKQCVGEDLLKENYPAIYAVGKASNERPRLLSLSWGQKNHPKIAILGKGVCFDSGGLDVKPSSAMRLMKKDMGGAAIALGLAEWVIRNKLPVQLQVLIPAVENVIGGNAFKPGDVLTMRNGLTVEVDNTDAEGRLVLADALSKACEEQPDLIIDFATLTGAARSAVGTELSAMFTDNENLARALYESGQQQSDPLWRLPLFDRYKPMLDSSIADLVNSSPSPYAGAVTAALFLQAFVDNSIPWVHFDLMAWNVSSKPGKPEGGEAMALRAVADYLAKTYK